MEALEPWGDGEDCALLEALPSLRLPARLDELCRSVSSVLPVLLGVLCWSWPRSIGLYCA